MDKDSEKWLEPECRKFIELMGGELLKWTSPGHRGVPDRLCLLPGGRLYLIEFKTLGKDLDALQKWWRKRLIALGFQHRMIDSEQSLNAFKDEVRAA